MNIIHCDDEQLSPHFRLYEFLRSDKAQAQRFDDPNTPWNDIEGLDNTPPPAVIEALRFTAEHMETVRAALGGKRIDISSGFRCLTLNRALKSKDTSDHVKGWAVDFVCPSYGSPEDICHRLVSSDVRYKQLIFEHTWVHISFDLLGELAGNPPKRQVLTLMAGGTYAPGIVSKA